MSRKVLTMNGAFHPKSDVDGLFVSTEDGGRGLITCGGGGGGRGRKQFGGVCEEFFGRSTARG